MNKSRLQIWREREAEQAAYEISLREWRRSAQQPPTAKKRKRKPRKPTPPPEPAQLANMVWFDQAREAHKRQRKESMNAWARRLWGLMQEAPVAKPWTSWKTVRRRLYDEA
jgi:hypothetical protein